MSDTIGFKIYVKEVQEFLALDMINRVIPCKKNLLQMETQRQKVSKLTRGLCITMNLVKLYNFDK